MADLIVPKSPIQGGAAAQVRVEASGLGSAVSQFGGTIFGNAMNIRDEQDARELSQARIDMQSGLSDLRLEFEQISDPTVINNTFNPRVSDIRADVVGGLTERLRSRGGLAFDELSQRHGAALGARAVTLHQDHMVTNLNTQRTLAIEAGANADEGTRETLALNYADGLEEAVNTGAMSISEAAAKLATFTRDADTTAALGALNANPAALAEALRAGEYAGIAGTQRPTLLARADAAAATLTNRAQTAAEKLAGTQLGNVITAANQGRIFATETDILDTPEFRNHPNFNEAVAAVNLRDDRPEIAQMPPDQLRAAIAEERGKTVANGYDNDRLQAMETILANSEKGWRDDPVVQAESVGLMPPRAPEDLANADEQSLVNFFSERASFAEGLVEGGYTDDPVFFSAEERDQITALTAADQDPADRVRLAALISAGFGDNAHQALANLGADTVFTHMAGQLAGGGNPQAAELAFRGQQAIAAGTVDLPTTAEARGQLYDSYANLFDDLGNGAAMKKLMLETATAIWAGGANAQAADGELFDENFEKALSAALGGSTNARGQQTGGIQEIGNSPAWTVFAGGVDTLMPIGMTAEEFNGAWGRSIEAFDTEGAAPLEAWRVASLTGDAPTFAGRDLTAAEVSNLHFKAIGDGVYQMFYSSGGTWPIEAGGTGSPYLLDMRAFVEAMRQ